METAGTDELAETFEDSSGNTGASSFDDDGSLETGSDDSGSELISMEETGAETAGFDSPFEAGAAMAAPALSLSDETILISFLQDKKPLTSLMIV